MHKSKMGTNHQTSVLQKTIKRFQWVKLNASQQCVAVAKTANLILGCIDKSIICKTHKVIILPYLALVRPQLYPVSSLYPVLGSTLRTDQLGRLHWRATRNRRKKKKLKEQFVQSRKEKPGRKRGNCFVIIPI